MSVLDVPRRPWRAALGALFAIPVGHVYAGHPWRGIAFLLAILLQIPVLSVWLIDAPRGLLAMTAMGLAVVSFWGLMAFDASTLARRGAVNYALRPYNRWFVYVAASVLASVAIDAVNVATKSSVVEAYRIPAGPMLPALQVGDHLLVDKRAYNKAAPQRFDVVVFEYPKDRSKDFIKRVIGLPGDRIELRDKNVFINDTRLAEPFGLGEPLLVEFDRSPRTNYGPMTVPAGHVFLMGDNRDYSYDSRYWGTVSIDKIRGKAMWIYLSLDDQKGAVRWSRIGQMIE